MAIKITPSELNTRELISDREKNPASLIGLKHSHGHAMIMRKQHQPALWNGRCIEALALFDGAQRVQVEPHGPADVEMGGRGNQVADEAGVLALTLNVYGHQPMRMAGKALNANARADQCFGGLNQPHLTAGDHRLVIVCNVADAVALPLAAAMLYLAQMGNILRIRKEGLGLATFVEHRVPTTVVPVQVRVDDDVNVLRPEPCGNQRRRQTA